MRTVAAAVVLSVSLTSAFAFAEAPAAHASSCADSAISVTSLNPPVFYRDTSKNQSPVLTSGYAGYRVSTTAARSDVWVQIGNFAGGALTLAASQPAAMPLGTLAAGQSAPAFFLLDSAAASASAQTHVITVYHGMPGAAGSTVLCTASQSFASVQETIAASANKLDTVNPVTVSTTTPQLGGSIVVTVHGSTGTIGAGTTDDPDGVYMTPTALASWPAAAFRLVHTALTISPDGTAPQQTYTDLLRLGSLASAARPYTATYTFAITGTTSTSTTPFPIQQIASGTQIKHTDTSSLASIAPIPAASNPLRVTLNASPADLPTTGGQVTYSETLTSTSTTPSSVDALRASIPSGTTYVTGSSALNGTPITDPSISGTSLLWDGPFTATASSPATLTVAVAVPGTPGVYSANGTGQLATAVIDTSATTSGGSPATVSVVVPSADAQPQTITFPPLADTAVGGTPPALAATASSGLPVGYSTSTPSVCTVSGDALTLLSVGTCTVDADQPGSAAYTAAPQVAQSFAVVPDGVAAQTISFAALPDTTVYGAPPALLASASSGLTVGFASDTPDVCSVDGGALTVSVSGTCTITASQGGDTHWAPAEDVTRSFTIAPEPQTITFPALAGTTVGADPSALSATASSGLGVTFSSDTPDVCTVAGATVTPLAAGTCTVTADQPGDAHWAPAPSVTRSLAVAAAPPAAQPPADQPPAAQPPADQPPAVQPPAPHQPASHAPAPAPALPAPTAGSGHTVATAPSRVDLGGLPAGATLSVPAAATAVPGVAAVSVDGTSVTVRAERGFTGHLTVPVEITSASGVQHASVTVTVNPPAATGVTATPASHGGTTVAWQPAEGAIGYAVSARNQRLCTTTTTSCHTAAVLGPNTRLTVTALGRESTVSELAASSYRTPAAPVSIGNVHFATDSARLTAAERAIVRHVAAVVRGQGFHVVTLDGYTDSRASYAYNRDLSRRRAVAVSRLLDQLLGDHRVRFVVRFHSYDEPVATNATGAGRERNRRTEISVS